MYKQHYLEWELDPPLLSGENQETRVLLILLNQHLFPHVVQQGSSKRSWRSPALQPPGWHPPWIEECGCKSLTRKWA